MDLEQLRAWPVDTVARAAPPITVSPISGWTGASADAAGVLAARINGRSEQTHRKALALSAISASAATQVRDLHRELAALQSRASAAGMVLTPSGIAVGPGNAPLAAELSRLGADLLRRANAVDDMVAELLRELIDTPPAEPVPGPIGSATTAHQRNLVAIGTERRHLRADLAQTSGAERWRVERKLDDLTAIENILRTHPDALLLRLDMSGERGRAAVAIGNPDTAQHISVTVPGLDSDISSSLPRMVDEAAALRTTAQGLVAEPGQQVATIAWLDYLPPQLEGPATANVGGRGVGPGLWQITSAARAQAGAARLDAFLDELGGPGRHLTVLGHSYGSLTASLALQQDTPQSVDDAVFYGSPGLMAASAADVRLNPGHAYVLEAAGDPVADIGVTGRFGPDPSSASFTRLSTEAQPAAADRPPLAAATGHSQYPHAGTTSQFNLAAIVAGRPDLAIR